MGWHCFAAGVSDRNWCDGVAMFIADSNRRGVVALPLIAPLHQRYQRREEGLSLGGDPVEWPPLSTIALQNPSLDKARQANHEDVPRYAQASLKIAVCRTPRRGL